MAQYCYARADAANALQPILFLPFSIPHPHIALSSLNVKPLPRLGLLHVHNVYTLRKATPALTRKMPWRLKSRNTRSDLRQMPVGRIHPLMHLRCPSQATREYRPDGHSVQFDKEPNRVLRRDSDGWMRELTVSYAQRRRRGNAKPGAPRRLESRAACERACCSCCCRKISNSYRIMKRSAAYSLQNAPQLRIIINHMHVRIQRPSHETLRFTTSLLARPLTPSSRLVWSPRSASYASTPGTPGTKFPATSPYSTSRSKSAPSH